jgi:hypothetical protein
MPRFAVSPLRIVLVPVLLASTALAHAQTTVIERSVVVAPPAGSVLETSRPVPISMPGSPAQIVRETVILQTPRQALASLPFNEHVMAHAKRVKLDPALIHAVILVESNHNPLALSPKGALGLMQLMPETGLRFGVRQREIPAENIRGGTTYLRFLVDLFKGDLQLALAAYNAGEDAVIRNGHRIPPYLETVLYVPKVLAEYKRLRGPTPTYGPPIRELPDGRWQVVVKNER